MRIKNGSLVIGIIATISGGIISRMAYDTFGLLLNTFASQNNPVNELKGQIGIILLVFTILCIGILIGKYAKRKDKGYVTGINNKGYKSNLDSKLRDIGDQPQ